MLDAMPVSRLGDCCFQNGTRLQRILSHLKQPSRMGMADYLRTGP